MSQDFIDRATIAIHGLQKSTLHDCPFAVCDEDTSVLYTRVLYSEPSAYLRCATRIGAQDERIIDRDFIFKESGTLYGQITCGFDIAIGSIKMNGSIIYIARWGVVSCGARTVLREVDLLDRNDCVFEITRDGEGLRVADPTNERTGTKGNSKRQSTGTRAKHSVVGRHRFVWYKKLKSYPKYIR